MKNAIVFLSLIAPLILSEPAAALPEENVSETIVTYLEQGNPCSDGKDFWHRDKVNSRLNGYSRPEPKLDFGLVALLNLQIATDGEGVAEEVIVDLVLDPEITLKMESPALKDDGLKYGLRYSRFGCSDDKKKITKSAEIEKLPRKVAG